MGRVVVLGSLSQDLHLELARHPSTGETVMSGDIEYRYGGKGANQAVAAARAGAHAVFVGLVGADPHGEEYRRRLGLFGVDTSRLGTSPDSPTGTAIILIDDDRDNMIVVAPGANHRVGQPELELLADLGPDDVLLMPLELPLPVVQQAARLARRQGARCILNLAPYARLDPDVLAGCDPVVVNEHEHAQLVADGLDVPELLITRGAAGSSWGTVQVAAVRVDPVDTTGAGDAYCGTLAARLALGDDPTTAMSKASAAAAQTVRHPGAQPPLPAPHRQ